MIDPKDLAKIDNQIKIQKGAIPMRFEKDDGDESPPDIEKAIQGMGQNEDMQQASGQIDVATALRGFWKFVDMMISMLCSRIDAIEYKNLSDAELMNISQQTAQVEVFQKLAVAENAPMWLSCANLIGTFGTKFSLSPEFKAKQAQKKIDAEMAKRTEAKINKMSEKQMEMLQRIRQNPEVPTPIEQAIKEPVYDAPPLDNSQPIEVLDESERRIKEQLAAASEVTDEDMAKMKIARRAAAIKRKHEEDLAKKRAQSGINGVGILE